MNWVMVIALVCVATTGCSKGSESKCKQAIKNVFAITGLDKSTSSQDEAAAIRSCRSSASGKTIDCMIEAKTTEDVEKCSGGVKTTLGGPKKGDAGKPDDSVTKPDDGAAAKPDEGAAAKPDEGAAAKPDEGAAAKPDEGAAAKPDEGAAAKPDDAEANGGW